MSHFFNFTDLRLIIIAMSCGFLMSCNKGFTLKIGDQDIFAFGPQESCNFVTTNGLRVSWKSSVPVNLIITSSVPTQFDSEIYKAAATWNGYKGRYLITAHRDNSFTNGPGDDKQSAIYWSTDWNDEPTQQARTSVRWDISKIKDADIRINAKNFTYYKDSDLDTYGKIHFESLILHEMGHVLGLSHIEKSGSVMQAYLKTQTVRNVTSDTDNNSLNCEY